MSVGPGQSAESSSSVIIDSGGIASTSEEFSASDAADSTAVVASCDMVKSIASGAENVTGELGTSLVAEGVHLIVASPIDPAIQGSRAAGSSGTSPSWSRRPAHFFGVYDGHGGAQVANYCRERIHLALIEEIGSVKRGSGDNGGYDWKTKWEVAFTNCFGKVDDEVGGKGRGVVGSTEGSSSSVSFTLPSEPIAPETVGSTTVCWGFPHNPEGRSTPPRPDRPPTGVKQLFGHNNPTARIGTDGRPIART